MVCVYLQQHLSYSSLSKNLHILNSTRYQLHRPHFFFLESFNIKSTIFLYVMRLRDFMLQHFMSSECRLTLTSLDSNIFYQSFREKIRFKTTRCFVFLYSKIIVHKSNQNVEQFYISGPRLFCFERSWSIWRIQKKLWQEIFFWDWGDAKIWNLQIKLG